MEPQRLRRGKVAPSSFETSKVTGFNGATASPPWKDRLLPSISAADIRFNGATASPPWKVSDMASLFTTPSCFNGATASPPWKAALSCLLLHRIRRLQWSHSVSAVESPRPFSIVTTSPSFNGATASPPWKGRAPPPTESMTICGFNGATASPPWKANFALWDYDQAVALQWSHSVSAVESLRLLSLLRS